ncbi:DUF1801 domain-containing protein [Reichenbachiella agarivorans]|uniref:DUF1801 domain-containing protein n=1 Tax=Reichenbachiella agarivorans TaxID=2979464 RepID=A0ABY6CNB1_9BACT|nr:DUF1801 domain-containing protein [Reichenbachiella agarivorans]UXP31244.1 DUF1801 domain-containing protein [Reichenbachiella agarivorans]
MKNSEIDQYILRFPEAVQRQLQEIRATIKAAAPEAEEKMSYAMPTFFQYGNLVHFAGYKHHIGFYPAPSGISHFLRELSPYKKAKGSVQFPLDQPLPHSLIASIVKFRLEENYQQALVKKKIKTCAQGHQFYKSTDCPTCPICEKHNRPSQGFLSTVSAPARRALERQNISSLEQLATYSEKEILELHGIGKTTMPKLRKALADSKLNFSKP